MITGVRPNIQLYKKMVLDPIMIGSHREKGGATSIIFWGQKVAFIQVHGPPFGQNPWRATLPGALY